MKKFKTLHLHIGSPKCASTFLQAMFLDNLELLKQHGISYPTLTGKEMGNFTAINMNLNKKGEPARKFPNWFIHNNPKEVAPIQDIPSFFEDRYVPQITTNAALFSAEGLVHKKPEIFEFLTRHFEEIKIHLILRPKLQLVESHYLQRVKIGDYKFDISKLLDNSQARERIFEIGSFAKIYKTWAQAFGDSNMMLHFISPKFPSVNEQFIKSLQAGSPDAYQLPNRRNQSISLLEACALCTLPSTDNFSDYQENRKRVMRQLNQIEQPKEKKSLMTETISQQFLEFFKEDNNELVGLQNEITIEDLEQKVSRESTSFEEIINSSSFLQLKDCLLTEEEIKLSFDSIGTE